MRVKEARRAGKSYEEVRRGTPFADLDATWGKGFIKPEAFVMTILAGVPR